MRLDHLAAVARVKFHAVVVGRIVAGGDHDPGMGAGGTDRKRKLRRRTVLGKKQRVDAEHIERLRGLLGEGGRKITRVVRDHHAEFFARITLKQISAESGNGAAHVARVGHAVRQLEGEIGRSSGWGLPASALVTILPMVRPRIPPVPKAMSRKKRSSSSVQAWAASNSLMLMIDPRLPDRHRRARYSVGWKQEVWTGLLRSRQAEQACQNYKRSRELSKSNGVTFFQSGLSIANLSGDLCKTHFKRSVIPSLSRDQTRVAMQSSEGILIRNKREIPHLSERNMRLVPRQARDDGRVKEKRKMVYPPGGFYPFLFPPWLRNSPLPVPRTRRSPNFSCNSNRGAVYRPIPSETTARPCSNSRPPCPTNRGGHCNRPISGPICTVWPGPRNSGRPRSGSVCRVAHVL